MVMYMTKPCPVCGKEMPMHFSIVCKECFSDPAVQFTIYKTVGKQIEQKVINFYSQPRTIKRSMGF